MFQGCVLFWVIAVEYIYAENIDYAYQGIVCHMVLDITVQKHILDDAGSVLDDFNGPFFYVAVVSADALEPFRQYILKERRFVFTQSPRV